MGKYTLVRSVLSRPFVVSAIALLGVIASVVLMFQFLRHPFTGYESFGAVWQTHDMLVDYMNRSEGKWPSGWQDLPPSFAVTNQGYGAPDLDWIAQRISIDFAFDPSAAPTDAGGDQRANYIIRLADGTSNGETLAANERLMDYLRSARLAARRP